MKSGVNYGAMKQTALQQFYEFMEQNQYFIGNDLYGKYKELLQTEREQACDFTYAYMAYNKEGQSIEDFYDKTYGNESTSG